MEFWEQFAGRVIEGWELVRVLSANGPIAVFAVRRQGSDEQGAMKVLLLQSAQIAEQLRQWQVAADLAHPNLIRILGRGQTEFEGAGAAYIVTELAEDDLSTVLRDRPLTEKETAEMLEPVLAGVSYLHSKGVVHGRIRPSNVLAIGDRVKLSSDSLLPEGQGPVFARERDGYDAPELAQSFVPLTASDVWSLGALLSEALTQRATPAGDAKLPGAYGDIVAHSLLQDPGKRWSLAEMKARLRGPVVPVSPAAPPAPVVIEAKAAPIVLEAKPAPVNVPLREPFQRPIAEPEPKRNWKYAAIAGAAALVLLVVFLLARKPRDNAPAAVSPVAAVPAAPQIDRSQAEPSPPEQDEPAPIRATARKTANRWYVVVATYGRRRDAEKRAKSMSRKWPRFAVRVYEPPVENPHHLVVIGENLSRGEAFDLQRRARAAGMPRDLYVKQFGADR